MFHFLQETEVIKTKKSQCCAILPLYILVWVTMLLILPLLWLGWSQVTCYDITVISSILSTFHAIHAMNSTTLVGPVKASCFNSPPELSHIILAAYQGCCQAENTGYVKKFFLGCLSLFYKTLLYSSRSSQGAILAVCARNSCAWNSRVQNLVQAGSGT